MISSEVLVRGDRSRRQAARSPTSVNASFGSATGAMRSPCRIVDISTGGARLMLYQDLEPGLAIKVALPAKGLVDAHVVWANGREAGCRFDQPLDEATFVLLQLAAQGSAG